jgi:hypothetical protein
VHKVVDGAGTYKVLLKNPEGKGSASSFHWDTGAYTSQCSRVVAHKMGFIDSKAATFNILPPYREGAVVGKSVKRRTIRNARFELPTGEVVRGQLAIKPKGASMLGTSMIRQIRTMKVKFR